MEGRGRKSAASLAVISGSGIEATERPRAPADLTKEQSAEWLDVVNRMPADWFPRETWPLLAQYCKHICASRRVQQLVASIEEAEPFDLAAYDKALKMQERESRAIASLATKMRLSQQATYHRHKSKPPVTKKPWQSES